MCERRTIHTTIAALVILAGVAAGVRHKARARARLAPGDSVWRIGYELEIRATKSGARIAAGLPVDGTHARLFRHEIINPELRAVIAHARRGGESELVVAVPTEGIHRLSGQFDVHVSPESEWKTKPPGSPADPEERAYYLRSEPNVQIMDAAVLAALEHVRKGKLSKSELVRRLFAFCAENVLIASEAPRDAAAALRTGSARPLGKARALVALCRAARLPARLIVGFELVETPRASPHVWVEVFTGGRWISFDPVNGFAGAMPARFVVVRRAASQVVSGADAQTSIVQAFSVRRLRPPAGLSAPARNGLSVLDFTRLPLAARDTLAIILLLPLGALVTAICRNIIGLRTFGTFTPSLLALSFVYTDWRSGMVIFVVVLGLSLLNRAMLESLKLLVAPRLSIVLTVVVLLMALSVSAFEEIGQGVGARTLLLPMVILTTMVERFYITREEDGTTTALSLLGQTLLVAGACYLLLRWHALGLLVLTYPEIHGVTLAVLIWIGRYAGYRLTELWRFRDMPPPPGQPAPTLGERG